LTETVGLVGPESAAALGDKPGYEAASMTRPDASKFADGTTWVFWEGSGSVAKDSKRKVEESAVSTEAFMEAFEGIAEGSAAADSADDDNDDDDDDDETSASSLAVKKADAAAAAAASAEPSTAPTGPRVLSVGLAPAATAVPASGEATTAPAATTATAV
jgi:hypothetical protein